jgi:hypothetical protein
MRSIIVMAVVMCFVVNAAWAQSLALSIGIRETEAAGGATGGPAFANGGTLGGIEFINRDGQLLSLDGTWQLFTFTPASDPILAFAGTTANSILEGAWGTLEMLRIANVDGIDQPIRLWIDELTITERAGATVVGFETFAPGVEVIFQEPSFSGSTSANLVAGSSSAVTDAVAFAGDHAYEMNFQFVDDDPARWIRVSTFNTPNLPNPAVPLQYVAPGPGLDQPTISFYAKAIIIPEPGSLLLVGLGGMLLMRRGRRR